MADLMQMHGTATETQPHTMVTVDKFGRATIEGVGYTGAACTMMGEALRRAIGGGKDDHTEPKPEMFESTAERQEQTNW